MKGMMKKAILTVLIILVITTTYLLISYYRYNIFTDIKIKVDFGLRRLEMYNSIFHPFFNSGNVYDYYDDEHRIIKGKTTYEDGKLVRRITYYNNGEILLDVPIRNCSLHGTVRQFSENGKLKYSVDYNYGILNGKTIEYNETGQIINEVYYKNGLIYN